MHFRIEILRLRWRLAWAAILLWVAQAGRSGDPTPEVHSYLADLHHQLATAYQRAGKRKRARRHHILASEHAQWEPPPDSPPRAAAMAMPVPQPPIFTDARGKWIDPPDGAA